MIAPYMPNHDTSTMQVSVRMCGWAVCGCWWGGRAFSFHYWHVVVCGGGGYMYDCLLVSGWM